MNHRFQRSWRHLETSDLAIWLLYQPHFVDESAKAHRNKTYYEAGIQTGDMSSPTTCALLRELGSCLLPF